MQPGVLRVAAQGGERIFAADPSRVQGAGHRDLRRWPHHHRHRRWRFRVPPALPSRRALRRAQGVQADRLRRAPAHPPRRSRGREGVRVQRGGPLPLRQGVLLERLARRGHDLQGGPQQGRVLGHCGGAHEHCLQAPVHRHRGVLRGGGPVRARGFLPATQPLRAQRRVLQRPGRERGAHRVPVQVLRGLRGGDPGGRAGVLRRGRLPREELRGGRCLQGPRGWPLGLHLRVSVRVRAAVRARWHEDVQEEGLRDVREAVGDDPVCAACHLRPGAGGGQGGDGGGDGRGLRGGDERGEAGGLQGVRQANDLRPHVPEVECRHTPRPGRSGGLGVGPQLLPQSHPSEPGPYLVLHPGPGGALGVLRAGAGAGVHGRRCGLPVHARTFH
mmetsp:Transcript_21788/g.53019  ORF Transcript_21788/g.53019 Transcript_21788/m.53019 type:complete len:387 (+) Transcript_21788:1500-2660(+)